MFNTIRSQGSCLKWLPVGRQRNAQKLDECLTSIEIVDDYKMGRNGRFCCFFLCVCVCVCVCHPPLCPFSATKGAESLTVINEACARLLCKHSFALVISY